MSDNACVPDVGKAEIPDLVQTFPSYSPEFPATIILQRPTLDPSSPAIAPEAGQHLINDGFAHSKSEFILQYTTKTEPKEHTPSFFVNLEYE